MTTADKIAVLISLLATTLSFLVASRVFDNVPHLEDEIAYVWQARLISDGKLTLPTPEFKDSFLIPFVVDYESHRFGKYPLGWPVLLSIGVSLGLRAWLNPLLAGLAVWLIYRLGKLVFGEWVGLIAAGLTSVSPFFLLNTGSLLSHPMGLVLSTAFALFWLDLFRSETTFSISWRWVKVCTLALTLGVLVLSRPYTALAVAAPFSIHGLYLLIRGDRQTRQMLLVFGLFTLLISGLHFAWQAAVTGEATRNPYTLWWEYDRVGFGPGVGRLENGHTLRQGWVNTKHSLRAGYSDLFGWAQYSWIFLPFGLVALRQNWRGWLIAAIFPSMVIFYLAYWIGSWLYGPRYYFEAIQSLALVSSAGIAWIAGWPLKPGIALQPRLGWQKFRPLLVAGMVLILVTVNLFFYLPPRMAMMVDLYGIGAEQLAPFQTETAQELTPALVIVHTQRWMPYGALLELQDPALTTPFIFARSIGPRTNAALAKSFPERNVFHYYPEEPFVFYTGPRTP